MPSLFTQFHYHVSSLDDNMAPHKVNSVDEVVSYYHLKHARPATLLFLERALMDKARELSSTAQDYQDISMRVKLLASLAQTKLDKE